jgi:hypothetical protein
MASRGSVNRPGPARLLPSDGDYQSLRWHRTTAEERERGRANPSVPSWMGQSSGRGPDVCGHRAFRCYLQVEVRGCHRWGTHIELPNAVFGSLESFMTVDAAQHARDAHPDRMKSGLPPQPQGGTLGYGTFF